MAKFEKIIKGDFDDILKQLHKMILLDGVSMNLVDQSDHEIDYTKISVRVYDKYFMRNSSRASLSLTLVGREDKVFISAIGAGGGKGTLFNFSLGAESEMVLAVSNCIEEIEERRYQY